MYDYATSVYEKKKYAALTYRDSSLQFPKQSRQHLIIQELLIEKDKRTNHYNYLLFFPLFLFLTQIEPFCLHHFSCLSSKKKKKRWLAICHFDLKLAKRKYFTAESGVLLYEEGDIDRAYQYIQRSEKMPCFVMPFKNL
jgi:hypothetical protein